ncbi:NAD binding Rossmann fold oxidoreductase [Eremomyces bilateralis CBS 781.70]|uniref:NAD binding Rossmann fold oxidoreductase n=1 Tax=Eremomyces bilateralis CBS 781.70 TaxID=1392243 RepID=A0A6G1GB43_9PEZI|nr:NAD binding Rossmann fold oxidoreductase [Eremomyces bilateralis CBS 781.70]KAF1815069.1 NAD binding Rossmann fold oxidoreductase [Eremomyces bilateralis CBS 781.70]
MAPSTFNVVVVGYGLSAKVFHIPFIPQIPSLKLYGIVQRSPQPGNDAGAEHAGIKTWTDYSEMLQDEAVDVVVVTTPPESHFGMCESALRRSKHVVVEKPFVPTATEAQLLFELANERGLHIMVYQNRRYDSDFLTVSELIKGNVLGRIAEFESHFDRHRPDPPATSWKVDVSQPATGAIFDLGTHLIDQAVCLFGAPESVTAFLTNQRNVPEAPHDSFTVLLTYRDPELPLVTLKAGVVSAEAAQLRFWVRGTNASFRKSYLDVQEDQLRAGWAPSQEGFGVDPEEHYGTLTRWVDGRPEVQTLPTAVPETYKGFYQNVADTLRGISKSLVSGEEASTVMRVVELARESSESRKTLYL